MQPQDEPIESVTAEPGVSMVGKRQTDFRIARVLQVLDNNPLRTHQDLAQNCKISVSRLSHLFKDEVGINVKDYRRDCRLQLAAEMLLRTDMPIKGIAWSAGYRHYSSFVRAFKNHFGLSPVSYRKERQRQAS
jgi:AraC-like DNA-binding protein